MNLRRTILAGSGIAAAGAAAYVLERAGTRRWRAPADAIVAAGRNMPADLRHHFVEASDGGRVHVVERGEGATTVLLHGITLGVAAWAPQFRSLDGRVVAMAFRGHGQSRAGRDGCGFDRLGTDVLEVLAAIDVRDAVLVGHSMGGMVAQLLAIERPGDLAGRVERLVLAASSPGPILISRLAAALTLPATRALGGAERRGKAPIPKAMTVWAARTAFGAHPRAVDVELLRAMLDAMSPRALADLLPHLLSFDVRARLRGIRLPTTVLCGTRDLLTPPRTSRVIARSVPGATLELLEGCGHMVMLERAEELCATLR